MAFYVRLIFCGQNDLSNHGSVQKKNRKKPNVYNNNKGVYSLNQRYMHNKLKHNVTNFKDLAPFLNYKLTVHECVHNLHK